MKRIIPFLSLLSLFFVTSSYAGPAALINQTHLSLTLLSFFGIGILLAFTPCVLPMVPILSAILIGQQEAGKRRAFQLSLIFVLSMACTYAVAGMLAGYLGSTLQTILQTPWVIVGFSLIFVLMALSMFGYFNLTLPSFIQTRLHHTNNQMPSGTFLGVAAMGVLSTLIASPCVTAPLIAVLTFISQTGSALLGGLILFVLALGMGVPLLLFGIGQATLLPKAGHWMDTIKTLFGVMMLGLAIWMLSRVIPGNITLFLWAMLFVVSAVAFGALDFHAEKRLPPFTHGVSVLALIYGIILLIGAANGQEDIMNPLAHALVSDSINENASDFTLRPPSALFQYAQSLPALDAKLAAAKKENKAVMIEFFATWCPDCKAVDKEVLSDKEVQKAIRGVKAIRVDVSERNPINTEIMEKYHVVGVPTMVFLDKKGDAFTATELQNEISKEGLLATLKTLS